MFGGVEAGDGDEAGGGLDDYSASLGGVYAGVERAGRGEPVEFGGDDVGVGKAFCFCVAGDVVVSVESYGVVFRRRFARCCVWAAYGIIALCSFSFTRELEFPVGV